MLRAETVITIFLGIIIILVSMILWRVIIILGRKIFEATASFFCLFDLDRASSRMLSAIFWTGLGMCVIAHLLCF